MRQLLLTLLLLCVPAYPANAGDDNTDKPNTLTAKEAADGWLLLFDGETTFGWHAPNGSSWNNAQGMLAPCADRPGLLVTTSKFRACELKLQYIVKTPDPFVLPAYDDPRQPLIEFGCGSDGKRVSGKGHHFYLPDGSFGQLFRKERGPAHTGWVDLTMNLTEDGPDLVVRENCHGRDIDQTGNTRRNNDAADGHFALLGNGVIFRNIKVRPLDTRPLFDGKNLTGWKEAKPSKVAVTGQGELRLQGASELRTQDQWENFILQLECKSNGKGSIGIRETDEVVIRNEWEGKDRKRPVGEGTGGIAGVKPAREVVADDGEWFTMTIIVHGKHLAVWVNGYQTADYTAKRAGEKGPIRLQGHDANSDLSFRNIRIVELPATAE